MLHVRSAKGIRLISVFKMSVVQEGMSYCSISNGWQAGGSRWMATSVAEVSPRTEVLFELSLGAETKHISKENVH